jgi:outer membrane lipase/esterase
MALVAGYMANQMDAPLTVVSQGGISTTIAAEFVTAVLGRLDAYRTFQGGGSHPATAPLHAAPTAGQSAALGNWSAYGEVTYGSGSDEGQAPAIGSDRHSIGGTVGIERRVGPTVRLGGVFGYSTPTISLDVQNGHDHIDARQLAGYVSFTRTRWFADALFAYGRHGHALDRQGVIDVVRGRTSADAFSAAGESGYLFDVGPIRVGPFAGVTYTRAVIRAYAETGDSLVTMAVDQQDLDHATGQAGLQVRCPLPLGGGLYTPFINVTAAHGFAGPGRSVTTTQVTASALPVLTPVSLGSATYGNVGAGIAVRMARNVSGMVTVAASFARAGRREVSASGGFRVSF